MANPDQKTILVDNAFEEIKNICINLQKDTDASNSELKSLLKLIRRTLFAIVQQCEYSSEFCCALIKNLTRRPLIVSYMLSSVIHYICY